MSLSKNSINLANILTVSRMALSLVLLTVTPLGIAYGVIYACAVLTDVFDGMLARKNGTASDFGARLDGIADTLLFAVCAFTLLPCLTLPLYIWLWAAGVALIKAVSLITGFAKTHKTVFQHTLANKIAGGALSLFPLLRLTQYAAVLCVLATVAAVQEMYFTLKGKQIS